LQHAPENYRASVAAYFDCVFAGVGMWALVISDYDLIDGLIGGGIDYVPKASTVRFPGVGCRRETKK
jgi:hypothetical protein